MFHFAFLLLTTFILTACSVYDGMKNMEKNTEQMNQTTRDMNDTTRDLRNVTESMRAKTGEMSDDTEAMREATEDLLGKTSDMNRTIADMARTTTAMRDDMRSMNRATDTLTALSAEMERKTGDLYHDSRQGLSLELRLKTLIEMKNAKKQFAKIKYANLYYKAFEFQLWKNADSVDQEQLEYLRLQAAQEIIQTIDEIVPEGGRSLSPLSEKPYMQNLYALAAALHVVNNGETPLELAATTGNDDASFAGLSATSEDHTPAGVLALIVGALKEKKLIERGMMSSVELSPYAASILKFEEVAIYILQLRVQFLTAIVVKQLSTDDGDQLSWLKRAAMIIKPWEVKTYRRNVVQIQYYGWVLGEALATRDILASLGQSCPLDATLGRVIHNMRWSGENNFIAAPKSAALRVLEERFATLAE